MNLSNVKPPSGQVKKQRRIGQGMGSGRGKYSGRGAKGARSVSGYSKMRGFEGGQMPLHRRLPKRGFKSVQSAVLASATSARRRPSSRIPRRLRRRKESRTSLKFSAAAD
jgi:ribosomal protein L15